MANSLIEDVMNEGPINNDGGKKEKQPKNKKSKKAIIIILILLLIVIICAAVAIFLLSNQNSIKSAKQAFFESITKNNIEQIGSIDLYEELLGAVASENSSVSTNVDISYDSEDLSVNNISLNIDSQNDIENLETYSDITLNYSDNEIFNLEFLANTEGLALKSDEIVSNFVGARYAYLLGLDSLDNSDDEYNYDDSNDNTLYYDESSEDSYDNSSTDYSMTDGSLDTASLEESLQIYTDILNRNLDESQFTTNEVTLEMDSGTVDCTEYTLTMSEEQFLDICKQLLEGFETDANTIEIFTAVLSLYGYSESDLIDIVDNMIAQLESAEVDANSNIIIKVYDNNGETVKLSMQYSGITMEIEYVYGDTNSSIKLTAIEDETGDGLSYGITNSKSDLTQNLDFEVEIIEDSLVSQTLTIATEVVRSGASYTLNVEFEIQDSVTTISIDSTSDIEFTDVAIEDLTSENCVFLDDLSEEEQTQVLNQISERAQVVLSEKMSQLSFIDTNTNTTLVGQADDEEQTDTKEVAKQDLITAIQNEMTESINNGEEYTLQDLEELEVEGHTVEVEISENLAVVTVDGYTFNIDSEFNLSE